MNEGEVWWCTWHAYLNLFDMIWYACGVGATCEDVWRRDWDGCASVNRQREPGKRSIQQCQRGRTTWEFKQTLCNIMERCSQAEELFKLFLALNVPYGEQQLPSCVRSFPERADARLRLWARLGSVMGCLWGAQIVTLNDRRFLRLLLDASWRVF